MDNDAYGHLNNVVHYALFDSAVNGWLIERGLLDPRNSATYGIVAETGCRYHSEMAFPDRVTAGLRVSALGGSSVRYEIGLFREDDETAAAEGSSSTSMSTGPPTSRCRSAIVGAKRSGA